MSKDQEFEVEFPEEGVSFMVGSHESIAQVANREGVPILTACEDGQCGTCIVKVLDGEVDHRDRALTPEKRAENWMCTCVSRARGTRLTLEIW